MAVTINAVSLVQPTGLLDEALFPEGNLLYLADGWLQNAISKAAVNASTDPDGAATAWVYYRGYTAIADRLANAPSTIMVDGQVTRTTAADQRKYFSDKAIYWLEVYDGLTKTEDAAFGTRPSMRVPVVASW